MSVSRPRDRRSLVDAFIIFHVLAICCWTLPIPWPGASTVNDIVGGYMRYSGLWQNWNMFSPDASLLLRMDATVTFRDGTTKKWVFPQMEEMSVWRRYQKERYRKWAHDNVREDDNKVTWYPTAKFIARQCTERDNPAVKVALHRYWAEIPPPNENGEPLD